MIKTDRVVGTADALVESGLSDSECLCLAYELTCRALGNPKRPGYADDVEFVLALFDTIRPDWLTAGRADTGASSDDPH